MSFQSQENIMSIRPAKLLHSSGFFVILLQVLVCHEPVVKCYRWLSKSLPFTSERKANLSQQEFTHQIPNYTFQNSLRTISSETEVSWNRAGKCSFDLMVSKTANSDTKKNQFFRGPCHSLSQYLPHRSLWQVQAFILTGKKHNL